jgi:drug/metabolite transporter (DMT)-like permease
MRTVPYILVLVSAFTHAYWNFILKRVHATQVFIGLTKVAEVLLFSVPFIYFISRDEIPLLLYWPLYVVGALLVICAYIFLGRAYKTGDLSAVYPISRAGALLFLPGLAYLFIGERIDAIGLAAILLIILGLFSIQLPSFKPREVRLVLAGFKSPATVQAMLAAFTVACYTLWDKHSISYLPPFIYFYAYTAIAGITYAAFILITSRAEIVKREWANHKYSILQVGFLNTFSYMLVLLALKSVKASYVIALRQLSIAFGVFLGWKLLREFFPFPKKVGVALLLAGCFLISLAR